MKYTITTFNRDTGTIQIDVQLDNFTTTTTIEVPIVDGKFVVGEALTTLIDDTVATIARRVTAASTATNYHDVERLVAPTATPLVVQPPFTDPELSRQFHIMGLLDKRARALNFPSYAFLMMSPNAADDPHKEALQTYRTELNSQQ